MVVRSRDEKDISGRVQDELPRDHGRGQGQRETVVIIKRGLPVAKLVPVDTGVDEIFGIFCGRGSITGDVVSSALSADEWTRLR